MKTTSAKLTPEQKLAKIYFSVENYFKKLAAMEEAVKASNVAQTIHAFKGTEYWSALNMGLKSFTRVLSASQKKRSGMHFFMQAWKTIASHC